MVKPSKLYIYISIYYEHIGYIYITIYITIHLLLHITLWLFNIAMEAMALIEIDGLPINSMVDLSMANC